MILKTMKQLTLLTDCFRSVVPYKHLGHFWLDDVRQSIYKSGILYAAEEFFIEISREHGAKFAESIRDSGGRIDNISSVEVVYKSGEIFTCFVPRDDKNGVNTYQKAKFNKYGGFFLMVSKPPNRFDEAFPDDEINCDYYYGFDDTDTDGPIEDSEEAEEYKENKER